MRLSRPFFVTLVSMCIPAHAHVVCSLLERRAVVPTMRLRVYSDRFVIFSNLNSMEGNMRLRKECNTILHARRSVKDSSLCKTSRAIIRLRLKLYPGTFLKKALACQKSSCMSLRLI